MCRLIDLTDKTYGRLTVIGRKFPATKDKTWRRKHTYWKCRCSCGNILIVDGDRLRKGETKSCGCLQKELLSKRSGTHSMRKTRFYAIWCDIKQRCDNESCRAFSFYGGRGITYCDSWKFFENFKEDVYESYLKHCKEFGEKDTTLDRINVNGNYEKSNCKWATRKEQANNRRSNFLVNVGGVNMNLNHASKITGIGRATIAYRVKNNMDVYGNKLCNNTNIAGEYHEVR